MATGTIVMLLAGLVLPSCSNEHVRLSRAWKREHRCYKNLSKISLALKNYRADFGSFPRAKAGPTGELLYSWRVLILPYIECEPLYREYDLNASWDAPGNLELDIPEIYRCHSFKKFTGSKETTYFAANDLGGESMPRELLDVRGRKSVIVDSPIGSVHWAAPSEFSIADVAAHFSNGGVTHHAGILMADQQYVYRLPVNESYLPAGETSVSDFLQRALSSDPGLSLANFVEYPEQTKRTPGLE